MGNADSGILRARAPQDRDGDGDRHGDGDRDEDGAVRQGEAGSDARLPLPPSRPERGTPTLVQLGVAFLSLSLQK